MIPVYISNGAFITRYNGRDYHLIEKYLPRLNADGLEFLMYGVWDDDVKGLRGFLKGLHASIPVMHLDKQIGEVLAESGAEGRREALRLLKRDLITADEIGAEKLVMHLWNGMHSDSRFAYALELCEELFSIAGDRLTIENVTCRDNICLDHLLEIRERYPQASFTYDTKMAFLHNENALLGSEKYVELLKTGAITHLHMNDSAHSANTGRSPILHIGDGEIDFKPIFALLKRWGYAGTATVESTTVAEDGFVDTDKINASLETVRSGLNG